MGNPPFSGARYMSKEQKADLMNVFDGCKNAGDLDFVTAWFMRAAELMRGTTTKTAFVATNSISQGQQVAILWPPLVQMGCHIDYAYRTFKWSNEAKNTAAVHCVIVGFSCGQEQQQKMLVNEKDTASYVLHINGYLVGAPDIYIANRSKPLCDVPEMAMGNQPIDDGNYLFTEEEKISFLKIEPNAAPYFRPWLGGEEFINGKIRYCLWLGRCAPNELDKLPESMKRVEAVRLFRASSKRAATNRLANYPRNFQTENIPQGTYIAVPEVSSEIRRFIPIGFLSPDILCSNLLRLVPDATLYHFGVLTSSMHMAWTRAICGRLEMRYRYSNKLVYNNYPWPTPTDEQKAKIEECAQIVLETRAMYPNSSLAALYHPDKMPMELIKAHAKLDAAVEKAYGRKFNDDSDRVAFLFEMYKKLSEK